jgi:4-azaleucine resistance transporter AzlC
MRWETVELPVEQVKQKSEFTKGLQAGISIGIGYFPIALTFGLLAKSTHLSLLDTVLMSVIVFAGASQYISLNLLAAGVTGFEIVLTTFIVNIRHLLMAASLNEKMEEDAVWKKALYAFGMTDETFSIAATQKGTVSSAYFFGVIFIAYTSWVVNSALGHIVGANLPSVLQESMTIGLYAMFIGLLVPSMKQSAKVVHLAIIAASFNSIFVFSNVLSSGWAIVCSTILSSVIVEWIEQFRKKGVKLHAD